MNPTPPDIPEVPWPVHVARQNGQIETAQPAQPGHCPPPPPPLPPPEFPGWVRPRQQEATEAELLSQDSGAFAGKGRSKRRRGKGQGSSQASGKGSSHTSGSSQEAAQATSPHRRSPQPPLLSRGSKNHMRGHCHPCLVYYSSAGCPDEAMCNFCHYPHDEARLQEVRERLLTRRQATAAPEETGGGSVSDPGGSNCSSEGPGEQRMQTQRLLGPPMPGLLREQHDQLAQQQRQQQDGDEPIPGGSSGHWRVVRLSL
mmetsp:Transcript_27407/g.63307  ORF Transcript_27407/g.63307 Transcript_27407/m.63307 type:complete len:257 (-) Transcript_27407:119-889(-)